MVPMNAKNVTCQVSEKLILHMYVSIEMVQEKRKLWQIVSGKSFLSKMLVLYPKSLFKFSEIRNRAISGFWKC